MKIKGTLLATAAGFAAPVIGVSAAGAADLPRKAAPAPEPVPISWAGWYIGGHLGGAWIHSEFTGIDDFIGLSHSRSAFIGGGQIGYNWQNGNAVYGIEVDGSWLSAKGRTCLNSFCEKEWAESKIRWLVTVRGRIGLAVGNAMAYVTGGVAFAGVKGTISQCCQFIKSESKTKVGWVVGGGVEAMWTRNWSWALEGLFVDLGRHSVSGSECSGCSAKTSRFSHQAVIGRVKLNYRF